MSLRFSIYNMSSANSNGFNFSFPIEIHFVSFSCLSALTRTSNTMLSRVKLVRVGILVQFLILEKRLSLCYQLSYIHFIMLRYFFSELTVLNILYHKWMLNFVKSFSVSIEMIRWVSSAFVVYMLICRCSNILASLE